MNSKGAYIPRAQRAAKICERSEHKLNKGVIGGERLRAWPQSGHAQQSFVPQIDAKNLRTHSCSKQHE